MQMKNTKKMGRNDRTILLTDILKRLACSDNSVGMSELSREFSINKPYIYRLLSSLESIGWVSKSSISQKYKAGNELVNFGFLLTSRSYLTKITLPYLYELSNITNETTALSVRIGYERLFVQQITAKHDNCQTVIMGQRYPLWLGATGKSMAAYLSDAELDALIDKMRIELPTFNRGLTFNTEQYRNELKEIKTRGYAMSVGEYIPDACVLAAPIFDKQQAVIGSLIVRGILPSFSMEKANKYSFVVLRMTHKISLEMQNMDQ